MNDSAQGVQTRVLNNPMNLTAARNNTTTNSNFNQSQTPQSQARVRFSLPPNLQPAMRAEDELEIETGAHPRGGVRSAATRRRQSSPGRNGGGSGQHKILGRRQVVTERPAPSAEGEEEGNGGVKTVLRPRDFDGCRSCTRTGRKKKTQAGRIMSRRKPRKGDRVMILWEDRALAYSGTLGAMIVGAKWMFEMIYDDGYEVRENLDDVHWRFEKCSCKAPWYEPGDMSMDDLDGKDSLYSGRGGTCMSTKRGTTKRKTSNSRTSEEGRGNGRRNLGGRDGGRDLGSVNGKAGHAFIEEEVLDEDMSGRMANVGQMYVEEEVLDEDMTGRNTQIGATNRRGD